MTNGKNSHLLTMTIHGHNPLVAFGSFDCLLCHTPAPAGSRKSTAWWNISTMPVAKGRAMLDLKSVIDFPIAQPPQPDLVVTWENRDQIIGLLRQSNRLCEEIQNLWNGTGKGKRLSQEDADWFVELLARLVQLNDELGQIE